MPDGTYNLNGGFKPTMKRFADLDGPDCDAEPKGSGTTAYAWFAGLNRIEMD
jgi:hypothetical protein